MHAVCYYYDYIITKELIILTLSQSDCYRDTAQHDIFHVSGNDSAKSVLSFCRNEARDDAALSAGGRLFHVLVADTGNALSPSVEQRVACTTSVMESSTSRTSCSDLVRYASAVLCRHR